MILIRTVSTLIWKNTELYEDWSFLKIRPSEVNETEDMHLWVMRIFLIHKLGNIYSCSLIYIPNIKESN